MSRLQGVIGQQPGDHVLASLLATELQLPLFESEQGFLLSLTARVAATVILVDEQQLQLRQYSDAGNITIRIDPNASEIQRRIKGGRKQSFARALGLHKSVDLDILDATAGLGRDALVMHGLGARVSLIERSPELSALLKHALATQSAYGDRLEVLQCQDASQFLTSTQAGFDVIYLDPMYPQTRSKALPKKEMQLLRGLMHNEQDADSLLTPALAKARRVVVKRPPKGEYLAGQSPHHSIKAKRVRYDVYINPDN